jgi:2-keto-4-pentenoate hydratase
MSLPDPVTQALRAQLRARQHALSARAGHVGWKIARSMPGVEEHLGPEGIVFGYLLSTSVLESGQQCRTAAAPTLFAETELALTLGRDVDPTADAAVCSQALAGVAVAVEIVDDAQPPGGHMHEIIAENVFHRAVAFGPTRPIAALSLQAFGHIAINGAVQAVGRIPEHPAESIMRIVRLLAAVGQRLRAGDRIITGSITHVPIQIGDEAVAEIRGLGAAAIRLAAEKPSN